MHEVRNVKAKFTQNSFKVGPCTLGAGIWLSIQAIILAPQKTVWAAFFHGSSYTKKKK